MNPRESIVELLKSYPYAVGGGGQAAALLGLPGVARHESVIHRMPELWSRGSYAELVRCLSELHEHDRQLFWHVTQRWPLAEVRPLTVPVRRHRFGSYPILAANCEIAGGLVHITGQSARVLVRRWHPDVDARPRHPRRLPGGGLAQQAVSWLEQEMRETTVPTDLLDVA